MIQLRLFGTLELTGSDGSSVLSVLSQPKRVALLAYLAAAQPCGFHTRDKLLALFWPESDEEHARNALRQSLHFLRRSLGEETILTRGEEVSANHELIRTDVVSFNEAVEAEELELAFEHYRGPLLEGFHLSGAPGFVDWLEGERERLRVSAVRVGEDLSSRLEAKGDLAGAVETARRVTRLAPGNGRAAQRLIELLGRRGDRAGAIRVYEAFKTRLSSDFGLEPSEEIEVAVERIRRGEGLGGFREWMVRSERTSSPLPPEEEEGPVEQEEHSGGQVTEARPRHPVRSEAPSRHPSLTGPRVALAVVVLTVAIGIVIVARILFPPDLRIPVFLRQVSPGPGTGYSMGFVTSIETELQDALNSSRELRLANHEDWVFVLGPSLSSDSLTLILSDREEDLDSLSVGISANLQADSVGPTITNLIHQLEMAIAGIPDSPQPALDRVNPAVVASLEDGWEFWVARNPMWFRIAEDRFREAVDLDPGYALAWASLADLHNVKGAYDYGLMQPGEAYDSAKRFADSAVSLNPDLAEAHAALATTRFFFEWNFEAAEEGYRRAIALDDEYAHAHHWMAILMAVQDRKEEAEEQIDLAIQLDSSAVFLGTRGRVLYFARRYSESRGEYAKALDLEPTFTPALLGRGLSAVMLGDYESAGRDYDRANTLLSGGAPIVWALQGHLSGLAGDTQAADEKIIRLEARKASGIFVPPEYFAMVYLGLGEHEEVMRYLNEAFDNGSSAMTILEVDPLLDGLRENPAFEDLLERVAAGRFQ